MEPKELSPQTDRSNIPSKLYSKVLASIVEIKGQPVIADADVAALYGVETRTINQAVKRNSERSPMITAFNFLKMKSKT
jgi:hypothetical protein